MRTVHCSARDVADLASAVTGQGRPLSFVVSGTSMCPTIRTGDRVVVAPADPERLDRDDIVMISGVRPRIHRIVRVDRSAGILVTRGDALADEDPPTSFGDVVGRVVRVERSFAAWSRWLLGKCKHFVTRALTRARGETNWL